MIYSLLLCLGDSLTFGARDPYLRNYPLELGASMSKATGEFWHCITEGFNGRSSSELARDCYPIVNRYPDVYGVVLLIGTNDSRLRIPPDIYEDNVRQIVTVCRMLGKRVYICTIPPVDISRHFLWYDQSAQDLIDEYNRRLHATYPAELIDIAPIIEHRHLIDGVHLNHEGNLLLASAVQQALLGGDRASG